MELNLILRYTSLKISARKLYHKRKANLSSILNQNEPKTSSPYPLSRLKIINPLTNDSIKSI